MKYEQIRNLLDEPFTNSIDSGQNGSTEKLIGKGRAEAPAQAEARDCSFERSLFKDSL